MVLLCFWEGPFGFLVFSGFPKGFATLVCIVYIKHMVCMVLVYIIYAVHMMQTGYIMYYSVWSAHGVIYSVCVARLVAVVYIVYALHSM